MKQMWHQIFYYYRQGNHTACQAILTDPYNLLRCELVSLPGKSFILKRAPSYELANTLELGKSWNHNFIGLERKGIVIGIVIPQVDP